MLTRLSRSRSDDAAAFYESRAGRQTAALLARRLQSVMPNTIARRVLGLGYTLPYLPRNATFCVSGRLNTALTQRLPMGARPLADCLIDSGRLPFDDLSMDIVLAVHGLEFARSAPDFLRSIWRVLTGDGTLVLVVPNRSGFWAHTDATPFGHGIPFSTNQLSRILEQGLFRIERHTGALMMPPAALHMTNGLLAERLGQTFGYALAGLHVVTARKNAFAGIPAGAEPALRRLTRAATEPA